MYSTTQSITDYINNKIQGATDNKIQVVEDNVYLSNITKLKYYGGSMSGNNFAIGSTVSAYIECEVDTEIDLLNKQIVFTQQISVDGVVSTIPIGLFTVTNVEKVDNKTHFYAYDDMIKFDVPYESKLSYPTTTTQILNEILSIVGIQSSATVTSRTIEENLESYTCREILGFIASLDGKNAFFDRNGKLVFSYIGGTITDKPTNLFYEMDLETSRKIDRAEVHKSYNVTFPLGAETSNNIMYITNPYVTNKNIGGITSWLNATTDLNVGEIIMLDDVRIDANDVLAFTFDNKEYAVFTSQLEHDFIACTTTIRCFPPYNSDYEYVAENPTTRQINRIEKVVDEQGNVIAEQGVMVNTLNNQIVNKVWKNDIVEAQSTSKAEDTNILLTDSADGNAISLEVDGRSTQKQYSGKNLLDCSGLSATTINGITFTPTYNDNNELLYINVHGTATGYAYYHIPLSYMSGTYIFSSNDNNIGCYVYDKTTNTVVAAQNTQFTLTNGNTQVVVFDVGSGKTISNVKVYPMIRLASITDSTYEPYTNGASPNPDYPQSIENVGNWFDGELLQGVYNSSTGVWTSNSGYVCSKNKIPCKAGDTVKVTVSGVTDGVMLSYYNANGYVSYGWIGEAQNEYLYTIPNNVTEFALNIRNQKGINTSTVGKITMTINDTYAVYVKSNGKNLLEHNNGNLTAGGLTFVLNDDKSLTISGTTTGANNYNLVIGRKLKKGKYIISGMKGVSASSSGDLLIRVYDTAKKLYLANLRNGNDELMFNVDEDLYNVNIYINFNTVGVTYSGTVYPMLRYAEVTDSTYEPHKENTTYIPLDEPLRSVSDIKDQIIVQDGQYGVLRRVGCIDDLSNLNWAANSVYGYYANTNPSYPKPAFTSDNIAVNGLCESYRLDSWNNLYHKGTNSGLLAFTSKTYIGVSSNVTTVDELKNILSGKKLIYELETPIFEPFADQSPFYNIKTYNSVTNISNADDTNMRVEYYRNTNDGQKLATSYSQSIQNVDGFKQEVSKTYSTKESVEEVKTVAEQTADRLSWVVKSGTSATDFELTDKVAQLTAEQINLNGLVTFSGLDTSAQNQIIDAKNEAYAAQNMVGDVENNIYTKNTTTIDGGKITTGSISADKINTKQLFSGQVVIFDSSQSTGMITLNADEGRITTTGRGQFGNGISCLEGGLSSQNSEFEALSLTRLGSTLGAGITFNNNNGELGSIGMTGKQDGGLMRWGAYSDESYVVLDTGNYSSYVVPKTGGTYTGAVGFSYVNSNIVPSVSGKNLGSSSDRWNTLYVVNEVNESSDRRLKHNIQPMSDKYVKMFDKLVPCTYILNDDVDQNRISCGYIAQEVEQSALDVGLNPEECGFITKNWVEKDDYQGYEYSLNYRSLAVIMASKVQEIDARVKSLEEEMKVKDALISDLQKQLWEQA